MKEVTVSIYALHEPGGDPWYVGCTKQGLPRRLGQHHSGSNSTTEIVTAFVTPDTVIGLIERVTGTVADCAQAEHDWIAHGREVGWPLVNGEGSRTYSTKQGRPTSEVTKAKIRRALQGRPDSAETRRRKSEGQRRRWQAVRDSHEP